MPLGTSEYLEIMEPEVLGAALDALVNSFLPRMELAMTFKVAAGCEPFPADHAEMRLHATVLHHVSRQMRLLHKSLGTKRTGVRLLVAMQHPVLLQGVSSGEGPRTLVALVLCPRGVWRRVL
jgi:hypothetical protein